MSYLFFAVIFILSFEANGTGRTALKNETIRVNFSNESFVTETQHTICSIKTEEVVAKAQSTASRILTGVCTTEEMTKGFNSLEKKFTEQLEEFRRNLTALIQLKLQSGVQRKNYRSSKSSAIKAVDYILDENTFLNPSSVNDTPHSKILQVDDNGEIKCIRVARRIH